MYLKNENELGELLDLDAASSASHVILNERFEVGTRSRDEAALPLSAVLKHVLAGKTNSFTALVGWFGHSGSIDEGAGESPAKIILDEAKDVEDTRSIDSDASSTFRLLIGVNCSRAARDTSRAWYWLCRYRHQSKDHGEQTDELRREFLTSASDKGFLEASRRLVAAFRPGQDARPFEHCPFAANDAASFAGCLEAEDGETGDGLREALAETVYVGSTRDIGPDPPRRDRSGFFTDNAAILLGFLLQRSGDFRINPKTSGQTTRVFHPKIYVVERTPAEQAAQTVSMVGSHNWTASAFGSESKDGVDSNVEVATIHVDAGLQWATRSPATLGHRVCGTARQLFSDAQYFVGYWNKPDDVEAPELVPADRLVGVTREVNDFKIPPPTKQSSSTTLPPALRTLVPALKRFAERLIGMAGDGADSSSLVNAWDDYRRAFADADNPPFGYTPAPYQSDAAFRLLTMLGMTPATSNGPRGGFLTDETGLGKTIVGLMVATCWIVERLKERATFERQDGQPIPLRASFVVPARLTGEVQERSGWHGHRGDVERVVRRLLAEQIDVTQNKKGWSLDALMDLLDLRVYSIGAFSRGFFGDDDPSNYGPDQKHDLLDLALDEDKADDLLHIALSEVMVVDESHHFRNADSRRTRTFRFLCSLPLPGESNWSLKLGPGHNAGDDHRDKADDKDSATRRHFKARRRMLCLSATPFNNEVSDLTTQIGHFDQYQYWGSAYHSFTDGMPRPLADALDAWQEAPATSKKTDLREPFGTLFRYVGRHLYSGRRLSPKADDMPAAGDRLQLDQSSDYGPYYLWRRDDHSEDEPIEYAKNLRVVEEWARQQSKQLEQADAAPDETEQTQKKLAQERMDKLLVKLFVQRSRARVLRMARTSRDQAAGELFRKPTIPRYPIALNEGPDRGHLEHDPHKQASSEFERKILAKLYRLLGEEDKKVTQQRGDTLSFTSYSISIGRAKGQGAAEHNFLGFQLTGLVKRLQSSPYAFFRTIVRGTLRHALGELALVEQLLEDIDEQRIELGRQHLLERNRDALRDALNKARTELTDYFGPILKPVAGVLGGRFEEYDADRRFFFRRLSASDKGSKDRSRQQKFTANLDVAHEALGGQQALTATEHGWLRDLVDDVKKIDEDAAQSGIWNDVKTILIWLRGEPGAPGLQNQLFEHISSGGQNYALLGAIRKRAAELVAGAGGEFREQRREAYGKWVKERLKDDPRLRSLVAWLLIQAQARRVSPADDGDGAILRSGTRSLVFTEYTDTQEYILAAYGALGALFWPFVVQQKDAARHLRDVRKVAEAVSELLGTEIHRVARRLAAWAETVQRQAGDAGRPHNQTFTKARKYNSPLVFDAPSDQQVLPGWLEPLVSGDLHVFAGAVREMCLKTGRICSGSGAGDAEPLFPDKSRPPRGTSPNTGHPRETNRDRSEQTWFFEDDDAGVEGLVVDDDALVGDDAIVDAFSPWYQIEPRENYDVDPGGRDDDQSDSLIEDCRRLEAAGATGIDALITTEVLAEGVNLQECGVVVHYDLPWNPTRLIQRNGRVDRRINANYEDPDKRDALLDNLLEAVRAYNERLESDDSTQQPIELQRDDIPSFHKPDQIYHMTVVPPEPHLDDVDDDRLVRRVRERIFVKLETIRSLFGLSTWPVVLDRDTARRVLSGELDYETPGFRRREELFSAWRQLQEVVDEHEIDDDGVDSSEDFLIDVDTDFAARLGAATAGVSAQPKSHPDDGQHAAATRWKQRLAGAALIQSSDYTDSMRTVRSPAESAGSANETVGFISGVYFLSLEHAPDAPPAMSTWFIANRKDDSLGARNHFEPRCIVAQDHSASHHRLDLVALDGYDDEPFRLHESAPASPAASAEDIFVELVNWLFDDPAGLSVRRGDNAHLQAADRQPFAILNEMAVLNAYLVRPFGNKLGPLKLPRQAPKCSDSTEPNFWLRISSPHN